MTKSRAYNEIIFISLKMKHVYGEGTRNYITKNHFFTGA